MNIGNNYKYMSTIKILLYNYKYMSTITILKTNMISLNEFRNILC